MGKDSLSNLVTGACMAPKNILYPNKEEWREKHKQGRKLNEELYVLSPLLVFSDSLNGLQIDLKLRTGNSDYLELNADMYSYYCLQDNVHDGDFRSWNKLNCQYWK